MSNSTFLLIYISSFLLFSLLKREVKLNTFFGGIIVDGGRSKTIGHRGDSVFNRPLAFSKVSRLFADMRHNHASPRALPVLYNCSFLFWGRVTLVHACTCILNDPVIQRWSYKFLHIQVSPVLVMSWSVVIIIVLIWTDAVSPAAKKSFCIYQSTTWLGRNRSEYRSFCEPYPK